MGTYSHHSYGGVKKGVELSNKIFMPLLFILFTILVIQSLRLPGAVQGLNAFFTPNWSAMMDYKVWLAAYGHTFFSLSVGFGIMVTYASYLKPKTNLTGSGLIVGFANASTEILAVLVSSQRLALWHMLQVLKLRML